MAAPTTPVSRSHEQDAINEAIDILQDAATSMRTLAPRHRSVLIRNALRDLSGAITDTLPDVCVSRHRITIPSLPRSPVTRFLADLKTYVTDGDSCTGQTVDLTASRREEWLSVHEPADLSGRYSSSMAPWVILVKDADSLIKPIDSVARSRYIGAHSCNGAQRAARWLKQVLIVRAELHSALQSLRAVIPQDACTLRPPHGASCCPAHRAYALCYNKKEQYCSLWPELAPGAEPALTAVSPVCIGVADPATAVIYQLPADDRWRDIMWLASSPWVEHHEVLSLKSCRSVSETVQWFDEAQQSTKGDRWDSVASLPADLEKATAQIYGDV